MNAACKSYLIRTKLRLFVTEISQLRLPLIGRFSPLPTFCYNMCRTQLDDHGQLYSRSIKKQKVMSLPAKPTYQQLVTSASGDYKKQSAQAIVKEVAANRGETDQNKCRHFVWSLKRFSRRKQLPKSCN